MPTNDQGSRAVTSNSRFADERECAANDSAQADRDADARRAARPGRTTSLSTSPWSAPSAMRKPSSRVRWLTEYDMTP